MLTRVAKITFLVRWVCRWVSGWVEGLIGRKPISASSEVEVEAKLGNKDIEILSSSVSFCNT